MLRRYVGNQPPGERGSSPCWISGKGLGVSAQPEVKWAHVSNRDYLEHPTIVKIYLGHSQLLTQVKKQVKQPYQKHANAKHSLHKYSQKVLLLVPFCLTIIYSWCELQQTITKGSRTLMFFDKIDN